MADRGEYPNVASLLLDRAHASPDTIAFVFPEVSWTYGDLLREARLRSAAFVAAGLGLGATVGVAMDDGPDFVATLFGACLAGLATVVFPLDVRATYLAPRLPLLKIDLFLLGGPGGRRFFEMLPEAFRLVGREPVPALHVQDPEFTAFLEAGVNAEYSADRQPEGLQAAGEDTFLVVFTSGLTGLPKHCWLSHRMLLSKVDPFAERFELRDVSRLWTGVSMFQTGFISPCLAAIAVGATTVCNCGLSDVETRTFLARERVTHAYPIYLGNWLPLINVPSFLASDFATLSHICLIGPVSALKRAQRALPQATVFNTYGSAELGGSVCMPRSIDTSEIRLGTSGYPLAGHEIRIVNPDTAEEMPRGRVGEIQLRGDGAPKPRFSSDFSSKFTEDGWLRTSDLGSINARGALKFAGRIAEMLKIGGETVSALDIESALLLHRDVAIAQVIARPDAQLGEVSAAFVEVRPGSRITALDLVAFCQEHLPADQVPRYVRFMTDWPKSSSKIFKPSLGDMSPGERLIP